MDPHDRGGWIRLTLSFLISFLFFLGFYRNLADKEKQKETVFLQVYYKTPAGDVVDILGGGIIDLCLFQRLNEKYSTII